MGDPRYIEVPGTGTHELPPLFIRTECTVAGEINLTSVMHEADDMLAERDADPVVIEQRRFDLALQLSEQYKRMMSHWLWGDSVLEWIRQCEITFEGREYLRPLLHPDVWPHAGRASFVTLLRDKHVPTNGVALEKAVGLRLTFRQPPPIDCFSSQFLFYLNSTVGDSAYQTWSHLFMNTPVIFPPDRFHFDVVNLDN